MKLYHGWLQIVRTPEIRQSNRTLDYGKGFCTHHGHYSNSPSSRQKK